MNKIAFIHDHRFVEKDGYIYSSGGLPASVWSTYLREDHHLHIFARAGNSNAKILSSHQNVTFHLSKEFNNGSDFFKKKHRISKELELFLNTCDAAIIRLPSSLGLIATNLCRKMDIPYAIEVVGDVFYSLYYYGNILGKLVAPLLYYKNKKAIEKSSHAIYVTQYYLQERYPCHGITSCASDVQISIDHSVLNKRTKRIDQQKNIICLTIGNVNVKYKGYTVMLKAMKYLRDKYSIDNIIYKVAGSGDFSSLKKEARKMNLDNQIFHLGNMNRDEIFELLDQIDIYIHPSFLEGLPRSVVEAMSRACPCLTSNVGGIPELIDEEFMHKPGDYKKLAMDIKKFIEDPETLNKSSKHGFLRSSNYSPEYLTKRKKEFWDIFFKSLKKND